MTFTNAAQAYMNACAMVKQAIENSPYKPTWLIEQLGFSKSPSAYYRRLAAGDWEPEHLQKLGHLLDKHIN